MDKKEKDFGWEMKGYSVIVRKDFREKLNYPENYYLARDGVKVEGQEKYRSPRHFWDEVESSVWLIDEHRRRHEKSQDRTDVV